MIQVLEIQLLLFPIVPICCINFSNCCHCCHVTAMPYQQSGVLILIRLSLGCGVHTPCIRTCSGTLAIFFRAATSIVTSRHAMFIRHFLCANSNYVLLRHAMLICHILCANSNYVLSPALEIILCISCRLKGLFFRRNYFILISWRQNTATLFIFWYDGICITVFQISARRLILF